MKGTDLEGLPITPPPAATNGTHRAPRRNGARNGAAPKRSAGSGPRADARPSPEPLAAPLAAPFDMIEAEPIDAPKWPLHSAAWFQPDLAPSVPVRNGLAIERRNRIPAPDFLHSDTAPPDRPEGLNRSPGALTPGTLTSGTRRQLPRSGLAPLGWEPRAIGRKEGGE